MDAVVNETKELPNLLNTSVGDNNDFFAQYADENVNMEVEEEADQNNVDIYNIPIINCYEVDSINEFSNNSDSSDNSKSGTVESSSSMHKINGTGMHYQLFV